MNTDNHGEENSPFRRRRLPSLNALRCFEAAARLENQGRMDDTIYRSPAPSENDEY